MFANHFNTSWHGLCTHRVMSTPCFLAQPFFYTFPRFLLPLSSTYSQASITAQSVFMEYRSTHIFPPNTTLSPCCQLNLCSLRLQTVGIDTIFHSLLTPKSMRADVLPVPPDVSFVPLHGESLPCFNRNTRPATAKLQCTLMLEGVLQDKI